VLACCVLQGGVGLASGQTAVVVAACRGPFVTRTWLLPSTARVSDPGGVDVGQIQRLQKVAIGTVSRMA